MLKKKNIGTTNTYGYDFCSTVWVWNQTSNISSTKLIALFNKKSKHQESTFLSLKHSASEENT